ncbi:putative ankyrin repeat protein [Xylaria castorea]|nr:putative ankyrin repeat protein [Xylaria castorea]
MSKRKYTSKDSQDIATNAEKRRNTTFGDSGTPTPQGNDTDEESDLEKFKEIPAEDITVAIFCALSYESVAVKYSLDDEFECRPKTIGPAKYVYSFGLIGEHKVVIARPHQMGAVKAAQCAATVCQQFPNVRFALMVGIGAGIPSLTKRDIRLGDIAVSIPQDGHPGALQYDFGKYEQGDKFVLKGSLNKPPPILIDADGSLEEDELMNKSKSLFGRILRKIIKKSGYTRPECGDVLYDQTFHHVGIGGGCSGCEVSSEKKVVVRAGRDKPGQPVVHRGLILSGGDVVKSPEDRDHLRRGHDDAICFEMEAVGIMDEIPCLVVRGIYDYAGTHKQDGWRYHAAATAAAYGRAVLLKVYGQDVAETMTMKDAMEKPTFLADVRSAAERKEILNWLTPIDSGSQQSDYLQRRQPGTGQWLLNSPDFQRWLRTAGQTLFCPGIPGAGKTILTSIVVENLNAQCFDDGSTGIAYIYCDFRRQDKHEIDDLLANLLKQLAQSQSNLPASLKDLYHHRHKENWTRPTLEDISKALQSVIATYSRTFLVIDALDECQAANGCRAEFLLELFNLQRQYRADIFATSRFIPEITDKFEGSISLEIRATPEDVKKYLDGHILQLPPFVVSDMRLQDEIKTTIGKSVDGMFLLAQLHLESLTGKVSIKAVRTALRELPAGPKAYDHAYEDAMERIENQHEDHKDLAKKVLSWIICARRQLLKSELQHALAVEIGEFQLDEDNIPQIMVAVCAGLVTVDEESGVIRLIHNTTQEYFKRTQTKWFPNAETEITTICVTYLSFSVFESGVCPTDADFEERQQSYLLYNYASHNWGYHARNALTFPKEAMDFLRQIKGLHLVAHFGLQEVIEALLGGTYLDSKDTFDRTPLLWALRNGQVTIAEMLLEKGADLESRDNDGRAPLLLAPPHSDDDEIYWLEAMAIKALLENSVYLESQNKDGILSFLTTAKRHKAALKLLLEHGADLHSIRNEMSRSEWIFDVVEKMER